MQEADLLIRNAAIKCIGLISLQSKEFATENFVLFLQVSMGKGEHRGGGGGEGLMASISLLKFSDCMFISKFIF